MTRALHAANEIAALDPESFVRAHQTGIWRYLRLLGASAADADDLLQETFLTFLRKAPPHPDAVPLLRTIARGLWIDRQRWLRRRRAVEWAEQIDDAIAAAPTDAQHEQRGRRLPPACRPRRGLRRLQRAEHRLLLRRDLNREVLSAPRFESRIPGVGRIVCPTAAHAAALATALGAPLPVTPRLLRLESGAPRHEK